jgi:ABC-type nitrate/sulfonate/bicarbonate transport system substrate-binding protein
MRKKRFAVMLSGVIGLSVVAACSSGGSGQSSASSPKLVTLKIALSESTTVDPNPYALEKGYFKAAGLNVELLPISNATIVSQVVSGRADLGTIGIPGPLLPAAQGQDPVVVAVLDGGGSAGFLAARPGISSPKDCKTVATFAAGTSIAAWTAYYQNTYKSNFQPVIISSTPAEVAALSSGKVDCAVGLGNAFAPLVAAGKAHLLIDPTKSSTLPPGFPSGIVEGTYFGLKSNLESKRAAIVKYFQVLVKTLDEMKKTPASQVAAVVHKQPNYQAATEQELAASYSQVTEPTIGDLPNNGYIPASIWPTELKWVANGGTSLQGGASNPLWSYSQRVDMSYLKAADLAP